MPSHTTLRPTAPGCHPQADSIALEHALIHRSLIKGFTDGSDVSARADMLAASLMGATAFQMGLGAMHAMSHPLGAHLDVHHGLANAVVMPYVLKRNWSAIEDRMADLARSLNLEGSVLDWVLSLRQAPIFTPGGWFYGARAQLAPDSVKDPTAGTNPIVLSAADYETLFNNALTGNLGA